MGGGSGCQCAGLCLVKQADEILHFGSVAPDPDEFAGKEDDRDRSVSMPRTVALPAPGLLLSE